jgi:hypothetical protein
VPERMMPSPSEKLKMPGVRLNQEIKTMATKKKAKKTVAKKSGSKKKK